MINVAILGGGFMGVTHANGWKELGDKANVSWVSSRTQEKAARVAETVSAQATTDLLAPIDDPDVDVVDVCLPTALHREACEKAFAAGKDVLLEKPIALTVDDANAIIQAAEQHKKKLVVGLVLRFFAEYVEIERRVKAGDIGQPMAASAYRLSPPADWNDWMRDHSQSGGPAVDLMVHDFDMLSLLLGKPGRVFARAVGLEKGVPGHIYAIVEYLDGTEGVVEGSMMMPSSYPFSAGIRVIGSEGVIEHGFRALPAEDGGNIGADVQSFLRLHPKKGETEAITVEAVDPWAAEIAYFEKCVRERREPIKSTGYEARDALLVSLAANRSLETGKTEVV